MNDDQKQRQKDNINEVMRFCMNKTDCRRAQVLAFFNEIFDPVNCNANCDVCLTRDKNVYEEEDVTEDAISLLRMVDNLRDKGKVTVMLAAEIWRGSNRAAVRAYSGNKYFGAGKDWDRAESERLVQFLLIEKGLQEYTTKNKAGWTNSYLEVSLDIHRVPQLGGVRKQEG